VPGHYAVTSMNAVEQQDWLRQIRVARPWLVLVVKFGAFVLMAGLGLLDLGTNLFRGTSRELVGSALVLMAVATTLVWIPSHPDGSRRLWRLAAGLSVASMLVTLLVIDSTYEESGSWGFAESVGMLIVLGLVVRWGPTPGAVVAGGLCWLAISLQPLRSGLSDTYVIFAMLQSMIAGAVGVGAGYLRITAYARERQVATIRAEQRAEFARDLHDFIAHHVTGIVVQAQGAKFIAASDPQRVITALDQIERAGAETMSAMRRMVGVLRSAGDAPLAPLAGVGDLGPLVEGFAASGGPQVRLHVDGALDHLPVEVTTSAYRVVMEALTNVRQHGQNVTAVDVSLRRTEDWLMVRIADNGAPFLRAGDRKGFGLVGLGERVEAVGGRVRAGPGIGRGWVVDAALPLGRTS
jgi:signal transduction histidine kinase